MEIIFNYISDNIYEFFGVTFSFIYVIFSIRQNILCWPALIIASLFNMYAYYLIHLPLQTSMQIFFIATAIYGWHTWKSIKNSRDLKITTWNYKKNLILISMGIFLVIIMTMILSKLNIKSIFHSNNPFSDSLILVFNIIPMYMTGKKILESWIYFIVIDIYSCIFFYLTESYFFSFLFLCYIGFATYGYITWKKEIK